VRRNKRQTQAQYQWTQMIKPRYYMDSSSGSHEDLEGWPFITRTAWPRRMNTLDSIDSSLRQR
jgi:hypothetical protein